MEEKLYYKEKRVSNSSLHYFEQSPLMFKKFLDGEIEQEEKRYLDRGTQIHMAILEPDEFKKNFTTVDFETPKSEQQKQFCEDYIKMVDKVLENEALLEAYKNNYKSATKEDKALEDARALKTKLIRYIEYLQKRKTFKDILTWADWNRISALKENVAKHKLAKELLMPDDLSTKEFYSELVILWEDPINKLQCKSMIDRLVVDHENKEVILVDLKTANSFKSFKDRCRDFQYFRQFAFYWYAITWWFKNVLNKDIGEYSKKTYLVALKTTDDAEVKVYSIDEVYLTEGWVDITKLLSDIAWHFENDKWDYTKAYYLGDGYDKL
jgi:hypothetical protein